MKSVVASLRPFIFYLECESSHEDSDECQQKAESNASADIEYQLRQRKTCGHFERVGDDILYSKNDIQWNL